MGYKKWQPQRNPVWEKKENTTLEGVYTKKKEVITENGTTYLYTIDTGGGKLVDIWGDKMLNDFFEAMKFGTKVKITYLGKKKSKRGGRKYNAYTFEYDDSTAVEETELTAEEVEKIFKEEA